MHRSKERIILSTHNFYHIIEINQIIYCKSSNSYTTFYTYNNEEITTSTSMKEIEKLLQNDNFIRIHQSYLVNVQFIKAIRKRSTSELILKNGECLPISNRKKNILLQFLEISIRIQD